MSLPLMPKATAVWLVENTALTFKQIGEFCGMHSLEIQAIADGDVASHIMGSDPVANGQLTWEEIKRCEANENACLTMAVHPEIEKLLSKGSKFLSTSKRLVRPAAILWLVKNHPQLTNSQIIKLVRSTKPTVLSIREKTHKNLNQIQPQNPVTLGLCSEADLNQAVAIANKNK
jgi:hypothetical protein